MFQAPAETEFESLGGLQLFKNKQRAGGGIGLRHEGLFAEGRKFVAVDLRANHPVQRADRHMTRFNTRFVAFVLEGGADFAAFDFTVFVVGIAGVQFERAEQALQVADLRGEGVVILLHANAHVVFGRGAVVGVVVTVGDARVAVIPCVGTANRTAVLSATAIAQAAFLLIAVVFAFRGVTIAGVTGDFQVIELTGVGVQVQGKRAVTGFQLACAAARGVGAAITQLACTLNAVDGFGGDAVVEGVDHATDGVAAVEQGGRATDDFDALNVDRIQWHGVVVGQRRSVQRAHAIAQNADPVAVQAANDRSAGARAEVRRRHTRLLVQGFTQAALLLQCQVITFQNGSGRSQLAAAQRVAGDDLGLQLQGIGGGGDKQGRGERRQTQTAQWAWQSRGGHCRFLGKGDEKRGAERSDNDCIVTI